MSDNMNELAKTVDQLVRKIANERKMDPTDVLTSMSMVMVGLAVDGAQDGKAAHALVGMIGMVSDAASDILYHTIVAEDQSAKSRKH